MPFDPNTAQVAQVGFDPGSAREFDASSAKPIEEDTSSAATAFGKSAAEATIPAAAGIAAMGPGMTAGAAIGAPLGPVGAAVGAVGGALVTSTVASWVANKAQEELTGMMSKDFLRKIGFDPETRAKERAQHPMASFAGELTPGLAAFKPGAASIKTRAAMAALGGGLEAGSELSREGKIDPAKVAVAAGAQAIFTTPRKATAKLMEATTPGARAARLASEKAELDAVMAKEAAAKAEQVAAKEKAEALPKADRKGGEIEFEKVPVEPSTDFGQIPEPALDYSQFLAEYKSKGITDQEIDRLWQTHQAEQAPKVSKEEAFARMEKQRDMDAAIDAERAKLLETLLEEPKEPSQRSLGMSGMGYGQRGALTFFTTDKWFKGTAKPGEPKYAQQLKHPITLTDGTVLEGFTSPDQLTFRGRTADGRGITIKSSELTPEKISGSKDNNQTASQVSSKLGQTKIAMGQRGSINLFSTTNAKDKFVNEMVRRHGEDYRGAAEKLYDEKNPPKLDPETTKADTNAVEKTILGRMFDKFAAKPLTTDQFISVRNHNIEAENRIYRGLRRDIETMVPELERRNAISVAIDKGDLSSLSTEERKVAEGVKQVLADLGREGVDEGVLKGLRDDYISHIVDWEGRPENEIRKIVKDLFEPGSGLEGTGTKTKYGKARKYGTFEELNNALEGTGLKLKTQDVGEIAETYARSMHRAIENKKLIDNLKVAKDDQGNPYLKHLGEGDWIPYGWKTSGNPQLRGYAIHPDLESSIKFVFENSDPNKITKGLLGLNMATKRLAVWGSLFHAGTLADAYTGAMGSKIFDPRYSINKALEQYYNGGAGDMVDTVIRNGLMVSLPEDVSRSIIPEIGKTADRVLPKQLGSKTATAVEFVPKQLDRVTWDYMHTGMKINVALVELEKAMQRNPNADINKLAKEVSSYVNNTFGGLNWFDVASRAQTKWGRDIAMALYSPSGRRALQILMFAPDWTVATVRAMTTSLGKGTGFKGLVNPQMEADFARRYQLRIAAIYYTLLNGINMATSGHPIWENKDETRIDLGDGREMQATKHSMEPVEWMQHPYKTALNKLGIIPKAFLETALGKEYLGPGAPDIPEGGRAAHLAKRALPISMQQSAITGDEGEATQDWKRFISGFLGRPIYGKTDEERAAYRAQQRKVRAEKQKKYKKSLED